MPSTTQPTFPSPGQLGLGTVTNFLDTLGVGSFAVTTAAMKLGRMIPDDEIPGTMNVGHALPTTLQSAIYLGIIAVDPLTMGSMVVAAACGAWFGAGRVSRWPKRTIQRAMAIALLVTAIFITLRQTGVFPSGGDATGLTGVALLIAVAASGVIGSLVSLGIGNYAPTMAVTYLLGMSPRAVFPVMATSGALMLLVAASRFYRAGRFNRRMALGLALGGIPGVLIAAFIVKSLDVTILLWVVVAVLLYTAGLLYHSSRTPEESIA
jgi:uncharacterized membrane protein YfcA